MKLTRCALFSLLLPAPACGKTATPLTPTDVCKLENDNQAVTFTAYLTVPIMVGACGSACSVEASDKWDYSKKTVSLELPVGTGPLTMKALPAITQNYQQIGAGSFVVHGSDGKEIGIGSRVQVTGTLRAKMLDLSKGMSSREIQAGAATKVLDCSTTPTEIIAVPAQRN